MGAAEAGDQAGAPRDVRAHVPGARAAARHGRHAAARLRPRAPLQARAGRAPSAMTMRRMTWVRPVVPAEGYHLSSGVFPLLSTQSF